MFFAKRRLFLLTVAVLLAAIIFTLAHTIFYEQRGDSAGIELKRFSLTDPVRSVHVVAVSRSLIPESFSIVVRLGSQGLLGREPLSKIAAAAHTNLPVLAALSGTFITPRRHYDGLVRGPYVQDGEVVVLSQERPLWPAWGIGQAGQLWLDQVVLHASLQHDAWGVRALKFNSPDPQAYTLYTPPSGARDGTGRTHTEGGTEYVLSSEIPQESLRLALGEHRLVVARRVEGGDTPFGRDEAVLAFGDQEEPPGLHDGEAVDLIIAAQADNTTGGCSLGDKPLAASDLKQLSSGGRVLLMERFGQAEIPDGVLRGGHARDPMAALCWNEETLHLVAVDGFRPGLIGFLKWISGLMRSEGITAAELAVFMKDILGCHCALELDGGKSATLMYRGGVVNNPAAGTEWPINGAILILRAEEGEPEI